MSSRNLKVKNGVVIKKSRKSYDETYDEPSFFETDMRVSFWATLIGVVVAIINGR
jgi:hypothetical protein